MKYEGGADISTVCPRMLEVDGTSAPNTITRTHVSGPNRRAKGVRSQCRRSLTLVENSLNPVEEIMSVPGAHAVPLLVQPTGGP